MAKTSVVIKESLIPVNEIPAGLGEIALFVYAKRGRTDKVYTIETVTDLYDIFGGPVESAEDLKTKGPSSLAIAEKLLGSGAVLKVARVDLGGTKAKTGSTGISLGGGAITVKFDAVASGSGYNGLVIDIKSIVTKQYVEDVLTPVHNGYFAITVKDSAGKVLESYSKVSFDISNDYYITNVLDSEYIAVSDVTISDTPGTYTDPTKGSVTYTGNLTGGTDGSVTTSTSYTTVQELLSSLDISYSILVIPGEYGPDACAKASPILSKRENTIFLFDVLNPFATGYTVQGADTKISECKAQLGTNADNAACVFPALYNGGKRFPVYTDYAALISKMHRDDIYYRAPSGLSHGVLGGRPILGLSESYIGTLQEDGINPLVIKNGSCVVWGNNTLAQTTDQISGLAIRLMVNVLKRRAYEISQNYLFELNNEATWNKWKNEFEPHIRTLFDAGAVANYAIVMDRSVMTEADIANGILRGVIMLQPVASIEQIYITFTVDETGVLFE